MKFEPIDHPIVDLPAVAISLNTLLFLIGLFLQTLIGVESTNEIPVQLSIQQVFKNIVWKYIGLHKLCKSIVRHYFRKLRLAFLNIENLKVLKAAKTAQMKKNYNTILFHWVTIIGELLDLFPILFFSRKGKKCWKNSSTRQKISVALLNNHKK